MDGFTVPVEAVESTAEAGARLSGVVAAVPLAAPLRELAAALPGSRVAKTAAQAAEQAGGGWVTALASLADRIAWHADQLTATSRAYRDADADADAAAATAMPPAPGRSR